MNNKIPFHQLAETVARLTSVSSDSAEAFIKGFFDILTEALEKGETVKIKGLGTFTPVNGNDDCVAFTPDRELAETVNAPFAPFQAEELNDGVTAEMLDGFNTTDTPADIATAVAAETETAEEAAPVEPEPEITPEPAMEKPVEEQVAPSEVKPVEVKPEAQAKHPETKPAPVITPIEEDPEEFVDKSKRQQPAVTPPVVEYAANKESDDMAETAEDEDDNENEGSKGGFGFGFLTGIIIGFALGACAAYFYIDSIMQHRGLSGGISIEASSDDEEADPEQVEALLNEAMALTQDTLPGIATTDTATTAGPQPAPETVSAQPAPSQPAPSQPAAQTSAPRKDTVQRGYLITNMAKKHYGNKCFWVYIYQENSSRLGNPNKVNAGTELLIPDASKYGIDANNPESVKKARALEAEILKKYPN